MSSMNNSDLSTLVRFNFWANSRILATAEQLTSEQFIAQVTPDPGWGSLQEILVHALDTEYGWRAVLEQHETDNILQAADFADVAALRTRWDVEEAAWLNYVSTLSPESIHQPYGDNTDGPHVWQTVMHVIMHSVQHRSEVAAILTGLGHSPGELDFAVYMQSNDRGAAA